MGDTLQLALSFTAIDAASGVINRLEKRIGALGKAGQQLQSDFDAMRDNFNRGLQGLGIAWSGWRMMKPGIEAAAEMQRMGLASASWLDDGAKSAAQINREMKAVGRTALQISETQPIGAGQAAEFQNLLLRKGFSAQAVTGSAPAALALAQLRGEAPEGMAELMELFKEQFGATSGEQLKAALDWTTRTSADPEEVRAALSRTGQQMHSMGMSLNEAITAAGMLKGKVARPGWAMDALLGGVLDTYANPESQGALWAQSTGLSFFKDNRFIGMAALQAELKQRFAGMSDASRLGVFDKIFGSGGGKAAEALFRSEDINTFMDAAAKRKGAIDSMTAQNKNYTASLLELGHAWHNMMGQLYAPLLPAMVAPLQAAKSAVSALGTGLSNHPVLAGSLGVGLAGVTAYGLYRALGGFLGAGKSALSLYGGLKQFGIPLFGGLAAGVAMDKAHEAATGEKSTSVFVTNWPPAMLSGAGMVGAVTAANAASAAAGAVGAGIGLKTLLQMTPLAALGASSAATVAALSAAGLLGYGAGTLLRQGGDWVADKTGISPWAALEDKMSRFFEDRAKTANLTNHVLINMSMDANGRVVADSNDMQTDVEVSNGTARGAYAG